jgi:hypothetical protein
VTIVSAIVIGILVALALILAAIVWDGTPPL